ncbi:fibronectin type III domain-containing protein [Nibricoccus aquaticus]|nr:fibronectin type III domain-containing protein [Nibricoccus aquaticus]
MKTHPPVSPTGFARLCAATSAALFALFVITSTVAAELKVDFNQNGRPLTETGSVGFTPWSPNATWFTSGANTISATFSGVTITFTRVGPQGTALKTDWWKEGLTTYGATLANDGITVDGGNAGGQIEMRIAGLTAGQHTLLTYHNTWANPATNTFSPLNISVNGTQVVSALPVTNRVTDDALAATSYLTFNAVSGQDVVILFAAVTTGSQTIKNVSIDGFEIDTPNLKLQATQPAPFDGDEHINADSGTTTLSWTKAASATSHDVYFGTDLNTVKNATRSTSGIFKGNQTGLTYGVTGINPHLTYYWRIDEVSTSGTTKGNVWYFRPRRLAFPGAEGYGRFARGGRGGVVVKVTNLNDSGAGSLREALTADVGPRTVVFDVAGLITLESRLTVSQPYITIAGQTAPGKGITVRKWTLGLSGADDVIVRHIRSRPGNISGATVDGMGMQGSNHCILDHCSISWTLDEAFSSRAAHNITLQRTLISEALNAAGHQNYPAGTEHGYAASIGGDIGSFHHNLLAHCYGRNWSLAGGLDAGGLFAGRLDISNNVVYNWGSRTTDGGAHEVNFVNNYYKPGAGTTLFTALNPTWDNFPGTQQYFMSGNVMPGRFTESNQAAGRTASGSNGGSVPTSYSPWVSAAFFASNVTTQTAGNAYKYVLSDVGANQPQIDNQDTRILTETLNGTFTYRGSYTNKAGFPDSQADVGGWESYPTVTRATNFDTDNDGLPDWWETMKGLNPNSGSGNFTDSNADPDGDGFTHLEDYLNWLAVPHVATTAGTAVDVPLLPLTKGFATTSTYTVSAPTGGTVSVVNSNTARFVPTSGFAGIGRFTFTVNDGTTTMTTQVQVAVQPSAATPAPTAPTNLAASAASSSQINLTWTDNSTNETGFKIERAASSGGTYTEIATTGSNATSYQNTGLSASTAYYYRVRAYNGGGNSAYTGIANATTQSAGGTGTTTTLQAEAASIGGGTVTETTNAGWLGTGYVNAPTTGGFCQFTSVNGGIGGSATLTIRYALASGSRTGQLLINGVTQAITFNATGAWTTWQTMNVTIPLNAGAINTIRFQTNGQDLANIDQIVVTAP